MLINTIIYAITYYAALLRCRHFDAISLILPRH